jgi:hypothetical protein
MIRRAEPFCHSTNRSLNAQPKGARPWRSALRHSQSHLKFVEVSGRVRNVGGAGRFGNLFARMRRTDVRPICRRRTISDLLVPSTVEIVDLLSVEGCPERTAQALPVLVGVEQSYTVCLAKTRSTSRISNLPAAPGATVKTR